MLYGFLIIFIIFNRNTRLCAHRAALLWVVCFLRDGLDRFPPREDPFVTIRDALSYKGEFGVFLPGMEALSFAQVRECWLSSPASLASAAFKNAQVVREKKGKGMRGGQKRKAPAGVRPAIGKDLPAPAAVADLAPDHVVSDDDEAQRPPSAGFCSCNKTDEENDPTDVFVQCSGEACVFNGWVHLQCVGDEAQYSHVLQGDGEDYYCPRCRELQ